MSKPHAPARTACPPALSILDHSQDATGKNLTAVCWFFSRFAASPIGRAPPHRIALVLCNRFTLFHRGLGSGALWRAASSRRPSPSEHPKVPGSLSSTGCPMRLPGGTLPALQRSLCPRHHPQPQMTIVGALKERIAVRQRN